MGKKMPAGFRNDPAPCGVSAGRFSYRLCAC
jgi:hypothetical protein